MIPISPSRHISVRLSRTPTRTAPVTLSSRIRTKKGEILDGEFLRLELGDVLRLRDYLTYGLHMDRVMSSGNMVLKMMRIGNRIVITSYRGSPRAIVVPVHLAHVLRDYLNDAIQILTTPY